MATLHYNTRNPYISDDVELLFRACGDCIDAIQFNVAFLPDEAEFRRIKAMHQVKIIAQVNGTIARDRSMQYISSSLSSMPVDHVLVDPSGGKGKEIDIDWSVSAYKTIRDRTSACIGFAGGFGDDNVEGRVKEYVKKIGTKAFSIDAEGKLRIPGNGGMDMKKVGGYIGGFFRGMSTT